ncbi:hypothetical protein [Nocardiopsis composta]|uniref:Uncharacterized protein n=1 Tax=Nocardiopsis composta TaxID=157465 RepID=A0A7W8VEM7_9ACTN|nr:hypothetical protein [Nocardiopsis composta]MBB5433104.1 hypothetical protein [Nocardiopsis composta]HLU72975.1 hypothetical protein [Nonomuraea sp.]
MRRAAVYAVRLLGAALVALGGFASAPPPSGPQSPGPAARAEPSAGAAPARDASSLQDARSLLVSAFLEKYTGAPSTRSDGEFADTRR